MTAYDEHKLAYPKKWDDEDEPEEGELTYEERKEQYEVNQWESNND